MFEIYNITLKLYFSTVHNSVTENHAAPLAWVVCFMLTCQCTLVVTLASSAPGRWTNQCKGNCLVMVVWGLLLHFFCLALLFV